LGEGDLSELTIFSQIKPEEMTALVAILGGGSDAVDKAHAEGVYVTGTRYVVTRIEDRSLYARQVRTELLALSP
jgi:profilin